MPRTRPQLRLNICDLALEDEYMRYSLDLGSETDTTPPPEYQPPLVRPRPSAASSPKAALRPRPAAAPSTDCGICFEHAVSPVHTACCAHVFCEDHLSAWLHSPAADGCCPACRAVVCAPSPVAPPSTSRAFEFDAPPTARMRAASVSSTASSSSDDASPPPSPDDDDDDDEPCDPAPHTPLLVIPSASALQTRHAPGGAVSLLRALSGLAAVFVLVQRGGWAA